ncbi:pentapeptide repeat-containing protein [Actinophytocola oryzae]|uniref:Pentapeptide repeat protein n=1 Tax=Actinophytocola oryzae TaxID=502181 RepID=A0A4R7UQR4_9PSEU|nr:pentapeptide repeat-containing protein [Actinophytocola oryzae]TDV35321.1 pentapeptide repeat protein [Actinophytocola oryzae]
MATHRPVAVSRRKIVGVTAALALLTAASVATLWWVGTRGLDGEQLVAARFDALKIGLSIGAGGGGLFALYLAWLRQRSTEADLDNRERTLDQQRVSAENTRLDATERRITELYVKGVEQLGSDKAPVRLGGLYALERVAMDYEAHRQTIVNVFCAYLRMPYVLPGADPTDDAQDRERIQEREVRRAAQRILRDHLRRDRKYWPDTAVDLTGANLVDFDLSRCHVAEARFTGAVFTGPASFESAQFAGQTSFEAAHFTTDAAFRHTRFTGSAFFGSAEFTGDAVFELATFDRSAMFESAVFGHNASFAAVHFAPTTNFEGTTFARRVPAEVARFLP